ncbi:MAG TPA: hypothetical protein VF190_09725 [Rhodothermales bacterium]
MSAYTTSSTIQSRHLGDWIASISLLPICAYYVFKGSETTILDTLCMLVFDAGRLLAGSVSAPLMHLGGAVMLVLLPLLLVWYFAAHGYRFGMQVFLFWLGQDLVFLGRTAISVHGRRPELLDAYQFDVHSILSFVQLVPTAEVIGQTLFMLGTVAFVTLLILPLYVPR